MKRVNSDPRTPTQHALSILNVQATHVFASDNQNDDRIGGLMVDNRIRFESLLLHNRTGRDSARV